MIVNPEETSRAYAYKMWLNAPNPMVTIFKTLDVSHILRLSRKKDLKFNMLMCWCIGKAASKIPEFFTLPVGKSLIRYDELAVSTVIDNKEGGINSCDVPFTENIRDFNDDYLRLTQLTARSCMNHDLEQSMVIGTSALVRTEIDGAVGMYSGIYNNPFLIWGKYRKRFLRTTLSLSFQFHHTQMDGAHAAEFLQQLQDEISRMIFH